MSTPLPGPPTSPKELQTSRAPAPAVPIRGIHVYQHAGNRSVWCKHRGGHST
jgi:hypothetical protein